MKYQLPTINFLVFILLFLIAQPIFAVYPQPVDNYVNDFANVLTEADRTVIRNNFSKLEHQTGIEATVVTINSIAEYGTGDAVFEQFATNLFNKWGIGHKEKNNGILILVSIKDRAVRIELGKGYPSLYDAKMKEVIDDVMIPYFKNSEYSRGIYEGSRAVIEKVTREVPWYEFYKIHILIGIGIIFLTAIGISFLKSGKKGWAWAFFVGAGILLLWLFKLLSSSSKSDGGGSSGGFGGGSSSGGGASGRW